MTDRSEGPSVGFSVSADRRLVRAAGRSRRFIRVELRAPVARDGQRRLPVNLAFVLDRSGSMDEGGKIQKARRAVVEGIRALGSEDRFSVVAYDDAVVVVVPSTPATLRARREAENLVNCIHPGGATDLCGGWLNGCEQVGLHLADDTVGRCLLLTDGLVNRGITNHGEIVRHCSALRERRIATTTFGVGADFDEGLLRRMADAGGGNFHFIEGASQIPEFIAKEVGETLQVTARDVALIVEAGAGVAVDSLNDLPSRRRDDGTWRVEVGSLFSGQSIDPLLRLIFPAGEKGEIREVTVGIQDRDEVFHGAYGRLTFEWAEDTACERQERDVSVDRRVAEVSAARAVQEALERNRARDYAGARRVVESTAGDIGDYAGDDPQTLGTLANLRLKLDDVTREMDAMSRKRGYAEAHGTLSFRPIAASAQPGEPGRRVEGSRNVVLLPVSQVRAVVDATVPHLAAAHPELFGDMIVDGRLSGADDGPVAGVPLEEYDCRNLVQLAFQLVPEARVRVVFTGRRLPEDGSSHWDQDYRTAVVSVADLEGQAAETPQAFVAAEIVFHALHLLGHGYDPIGVGHTETRGCLYDFSRTRANIEVFLEGGDLCPQCRDKLGRHLLEIRPLLNLAEAIRALTGCGPVVH